MNPWYPRTDKEFEKAIDDGLFDEGFAIIMGSMINRGKDFGKVCALIEFENKNVFESFFEHDIIKSKAADLGVKWNNDSKPNLVMFNVSKPLRNRNYKDVGLRVRGRGLYKNPKLPHQKPISLSLSETLALEEMMDLEYDIGFM